MMRIRCKTPGARGAPAAQPGQRRDVHIRLRECGDTADADDLHVFAAANADRNDHSEPRALTARSYSKRLPKLAGSSAPHGRPIPSRTGCGIARGPVETAARVRPATGPTRDPCGPHAKFVDIARRTSTSGSAYTAGRRTGRIEGTLRPSTSNRSQCSEARECAPHPDAADTRADDSNPQPASRTRRRTERSVGPAALQFRIPVLPFTAERDQRRRDEASRAKALPLAYSAS